MTTQDRIKAVTDLGLVSTAVGNEFVYELGDIAVPGNHIESLSDADFDNFLEEIKAFMVDNNYAAPAAPTQELTIIDKANAELSQGSKILQECKADVTRYLAAAYALTDAIKANGDVLNADLDKKANDAIVALMAIDTKLDEKTKPIRQAMTLIRDELLEGPKLLKAQKDIIQAYRNKWAIECKRVADENAAAERKAAAHRQELIDIKADIEKKLLQYFNEHLVEKKLGINTWFNGFTLETFDALEKKLRETNPMYATQHFATFKYTYAGTILTKDEALALVVEVSSEAKYQEFASLYLSEMNALKAEKIDLLGSKKAELTRVREFEIEQEKERIEQQRIALEQQTASDDRKKQLAKEQAESESRQREAREREQQETAEREQREAAEAEEQRKASEALLAQQTLKVDAVAAQSSTLSMFEQQQNSSPIATGPKLKTVLKAVITEPVGLYPFFQLWFESVGMSMTTEEIMKKFDFIFTYASKRANDKQPLMLETTKDGKSVFIAYVEETKSVTTKEKKEKEAA